MIKPEPAKFNVMLGAGGEFAIQPDDAPELPEGLDEGVREDGTVDGHVVETHYCPFLKLIDADGYLRVVADNDFTDVETRIPFAFLEAAGWRKS